MKETTKTRGTEGIKCSGAQILRFERRKTVLPEMKGSIPCAGDIIFYNEEPPGGFDRRGKNAVEKRGCMVITSVTKNLVNGYCLKKCGSGPNTVKMNFSMDINSFVLGKVRYVKLNEPVADNVFSYEETELIDGGRISEQIVKLSEDIRLKVIV